MIESQGYHPSDSNFQWLCLNLLVDMILQNATVTEGEPVPMQSTVRSSSPDRFRGCNDANVAMAAAACQQAMLACWKVIITCRIGPQTRFSRVVDERARYSAAYVTSTPLSGGMKPLHYHARHANLSTMRASPERSFTKRRCWGWLLPFCASHRSRLWCGRPQ